MPYLLHPPTKHITLRYLQNNCVPYYLSSTTPIDQAITEDVQKWGWPLQHRCLSNDCLNEDDHEYWYQCDSRSRAWMERSGAKKEIWKIWQKEHERRIQDGEQERLGGRKVKCWKLALVFGMGLLGGKVA
jgi:hypothetical protein